MTTRHSWWLGTAFIFLASACGGGNEADQIGVAAECSADDDCAEVVIDGEDVQLSCLLQFGGGYCAIEGCDDKADCPDGATCVAHDDGKNYCFRECVEKSECNINRTEEYAANCSANFDYATPSDNEEGVKACIPPSSGKGK